MSTRNPQLRFVKAEALGNDFLIVELVREADIALFPQKRVQSLCDRHRGVGADGVLLVLRGDPARMIVLNADGSRPEMCGNGVRCVAKYLCDSGEVDVMTDAGLRHCIVHKDHVTVDMGIGKVTGEVRVDDVGPGFSLVCVSMGNPHAVTFDDATEDDVDTYGPLLSSHALFEEGSNIEFATRIVGQPAFHVRVWERGVGPTLACGTGACAVAVAAVARGDAQVEQPLSVKLPGGDLAVVVHRTAHVSMTGPARLVFDGTYYA